MAGLMNLNKVMLVGRLTKDPELRYTAKGIPVGQFSLAVNTYLGGQNKREETLFIDVVCWNKIAENVSQYLQKGRMVYVEGRLLLNKWQAQDGTNRSKIEVNADRVNFLWDAKNEGGNNTSSETSPISETSNETDIPVSETDGDDSPF